jgi:hypothetical protein
LRQFITIGQLGDKMYSITFEENIATKEIQILGEGIDQSQSQLQFS